MSHAPGSPDVGPTTSYYQGVAAERERIIKLLRGNRCECLDLSGDELTQFIEAEPDKLKHMNCDWVGIDWVIELIKGEQK